MIRTLDPPAGSVGIDSKGDSVDLATYAGWEVKQTKKITNGVVVWVRPTRGQPAEKITLAEEVYKQASRLGG